MTHLSKNYCVINMGDSTTALVFYNTNGEPEVYIGNPSDIETESQNLKSAGFTANDKLIFNMREARQLPGPKIPQGIKHYDIEEVMQGDKITACTVRSVHESHGKLTPNSITFSIEEQLLNNETLYIKALRWVTQRTKAFTSILESEGMTRNTEFILNAFIYALENPQRLEKFIKGDRGKQTVTQNMI